MFREVLLEWYHKDGLIRMMPQGSLSEWWFKKLWNEGLLCARYLLLYELALFVCCKPQYKEKITNQKEQIHT